jgi:DNA (cytosine-5)-methyltransferase 1
MVKYICEKCGKEFKQKSHYDSHQKRKTPCDKSVVKTTIIVDKDHEENLELVVPENDESMVDNCKLKFIDLCSGIGGFHFGLNSHECMLACDINKMCRESYKTNFNIECEKDIFDLHTNDLCNFDILCAGFPCQPFSAAGLKNGMEDDRSKVYCKIIEIVSKKQPRIVLLENVKNLLIMDNGNVIKKIVSDLESLNYAVSFSLLNTSKFGLAQNRERLYIVCIHKNYSEMSFDFSELTSHNVSMTLKDVIDLSNNDYLDEDKYVLLEQDKIKSQASGLIFCGYLKGNLRKNGALPNTEHLSRVHKQPNRIYHIDGVNPTLSSSESSGRYYIYDGKGVRKLTYNECFKIMGFPENYIFHEKTNVNYSQIGNAVSPVIINKLHNELFRQGFI